MCLIIKKEKQDFLTIEFLNDVWKKNNDGWGITYNDPETNEVVALKGLLFTDFLTEYFRLDEAYIDFVIHMRYATHGVVNRKNCHPFKVMDGMYLMHNGIFAIDMGNEVKLSDTRVFIRDILRPLLDEVKDPFAFIQGYNFQHLMEWYCEGQDSRLVIHTKDGPLFFGDWKKTTKGVVVSNHYAFNLDNPTYKPLSSFGAANAWSYDEDGRLITASPSTTHAEAMRRFNERTDDEVGPDALGFYPDDHSLDERFRDLIESDDLYTQSLNDAVDNFDSIAQTYWELDDVEIDFVLDKLQEGSWYFEMDEFNPYASILWDEAGQIVRPETLKTFVTLSKVEYATA